MVSDAAGEVEIEVPRDREFEPQIVRKRQRRLSDVDEVVLSLYAKGLATGEISAHFAEISGASVSKETVSPITEKVVAEMSQPRGAVDIMALCVTVDVTDGCGAPHQRVGLHRGGGDEKRMGDIIVVAPWTY